MNIAEVLRLLAETYPKLDELSAGVSGQQLLAPLGPGERSFIETLVHILNCESRTFEAITLALLASEPLLTTIHAERDFGKLFRFERMPFSDLLAYFKFRRTVLLRVLKDLNEKQWSRVIRQEGKQRKESVYWQARGQALHELEHVLDIEGKLSPKADQPNTTE
ncbi:MAG: DinB family protein [Chloroflexota bacterium]